MPCLYIQGRPWSPTTGLGTLVIASSIFSLNYHRLIHEIQTCMISPFCHNLLKKFKALNLISTET